MATHDYDIANQAGLAFRTDLNSCLDAIQSNNSSSSEPATTVAYQWWADTNTNTLKIRNSSNNDWVILRSLDGGLQLADGSAASPSMTFADDTNTGIFSGAADQIGIATTGVERVNVTSSEVVFNDPSNDVDFRVESNGATHMLYVDGGNNHVGINDSTPDCSLHVNSGSADLVAKFQSTDGLARIEIVDSNATSQISQNGADLEISSDSGNADASSTIKFLVDNSAKAVIDNSGRLLLGKTTSVAPARRFQLAGTDGDTSSAVFTRNSANNGGPVIDLIKSRNATHGSFTIVQNDDTLGTIQFRGDDGTDYQSIGASINAEIDGAPGANDLPTRLVFSTTRNGANSPTEAVRITEEGYFRATSNASFYASAGNLHEFTNNVQTNEILNLRCTNTSFSQNTVGAFAVGVQRSSAQEYTIASFWSGNGTTHLHDREFRFRGDGSAFADGDWNTSGADYAENFEWSDGNSSNEDRRGISVVLVGDKIREAAEGEDPIGVISGNPSVIGDADDARWQGKYLRDDYGTYLQEDYQVVNDEGETVTQQRRVLNPDFDPDREHVAREFRPEWSPVGLMGKLRIRKGQVTGARWIKMRDVSDTVEEWLVR
tara:strand:- start:553 stop:2361 length:1809 start_codon:yes stop_codon:yes gene_type:complete